MYKNIDDELISMINKIAEPNIKKKIKPGTDYIPASGKVIDIEDLLFGIDAVLDGWLTTGRFSDQLEKQIATWCGAKYAYLVNSGSSANLLAFAALTSPKLGERSIKKGDEVITVAASFPTTLNPIIFYGCIPVFIDIDVQTCNIKAELVEKAINPKTKAIFLAHTLGNPFNLEVINYLVKKHNLWLIEDNCDALGAEYSDKKTGTFGHLGTVSCYPAHQITMGEGGLVLINDHQLKRIVESMRDWGRDCWCNTGKENTCGKRFEQKFGDLPFGYDHPNA